MNDTVTGSLSILKLLKGPSKDLTSFITHKTHGKINSCLHLKLS
jgi:hypothetical protein